MFDIAQAYWLIAAFLVYVGWHNLRERRWAHAAFWTILGILFAGGDSVIAASRAGQPLPAELAGVAVIVLALLAPRLGPATIADASTHEERIANAIRLGHKLFVPALLIPLVTLVVAVFGDHLAFAGHRLFDAKQMTLTGLALACVIALFAAAHVTGLSVRNGCAEGRRLLDTIGWAALLPLLLAALGGVFADSGVGAAIASLTSDYLPSGSAFVYLLAYALGMAIFTMIMGNAFAAFPVMTAGIGLPLLVTQYGAHPTVLGAMGMLSGYCGTLLTPMAANFNLVPAALLELKSPYAVIHAQVWSALAIFIVNFAMMCVFVFRPFS